MHSGPTDPEESGVILAAGLPAYFRQLTANFQCFSSENSFLDMVKTQYIETGCIH